MSFETRGTKENPYHLSIGAIVEDSSRYALIKKSDGYYTLPRETTYSNESIEDTLVRGMSEELGVIVKVRKFLGGLLIKFNHSDGKEIDKTTTYFLCSKIGDSKRVPEDSEVNDEISWVSKDELKKKLDSCKNPEADIVRRL